jgi:hypothetical protein
MPSFDIVSQVDLQEVDNAINQVSKEIGTRYDFRNTKSRVTHEGPEITVLADDDYKRRQVLEILVAKLVRRRIEPGVMEHGPVDSASGGLVRQVLTIRQGVGIELARAIVKTIKESKFKVQAAIQGDQVRVSGKNRDDLQQAIALVKARNDEQPLQYINFRP